MYIFCYPSSPSFDVFLKCEGMDFKWHIKNIMIYNLDMLKNIWQYILKLVRRQAEWTTLREREYCKNNKCASKAPEVVKIMLLVNHYYQNAVLGEWHYGLCFSPPLSELSFNAGITFLSVAMSICMYVHSTLIHENTIILFLQVTVLKVVSRETWCSWMKTSLRSLRTWIFTLALPPCSSNAWLFPLVFPLVKWRGWARCSPKFLFCPQSYNFFFFLPCV